MITNKVYCIILKSHGQNCYVPFTATFQWDPIDPLAVQIVCHLDEGDVVWTVGRELLHQGTTSLTGVGEGDVKFQKEGPVSSRMLACFTSPEGHADVALNQPHVVRFLNRTIAALPIGAEGLDADGGLIDDLIEEIYNA